MKKLTIICFLFFSLVFVNGCGKKDDLSPFAKLEVVARIMTEVEIWNTMNRGEKEALMLGIFMGMKHLSKSLKLASTLNELTDQAVNYVRNFNDIYGKGKINLHAVLCEIIVDDINKASEYGQR